eukprot:Gregarina_sp_Poly_1__4635@NODE_247_length_10750_cov_169_692315_g217_i0_p6_GENE_NODE_247_length_10750_cov_169_692315_g217_i0NODE_247_length_10750_cov_169_692315_g217_i0_p6_ORF_typecomplete_len250_score45_55_NODE_247_length_10750_cov_169_692315_g217_i05891338
MRGTMVPSAAAAAGVAQRRDINENLGKVFSALEDLECGTPAQSPDTAPAQLVEMEANAPRECREPAEQEPFLVPNAHKLESTDTATPDTVGNPTSKSEEGGVLCPVQDTTSLLFPFGGMPPFSPETQCVLQRAATDTSAYVRKSAPDEHNSNFDVFQLLPPPKQRTTPEAAPESTTPQFQDSSSEEPPKMESRASQADLHPPVDLSGLEESMRCAWRARTLLPMVGEVYCCLLPEERQYINYLDTVQEG